MFRATMTAAVVLITSAGCFAQMPKAKETAEQKAVRTYLKENLPTGKWEEIKWWPTVPGKAVGPDWDGTAVRLKYRAANEFGGMAVYDHVFTLSPKGKLTAHTDDPLYFNRDRIFSAK